MNADDVFRLWHQKEPRKYRLRKVALLSNPYMAKVGEAEEITYLSDKWEKNNDFYPYVHDHESNPGVYFVEDVTHEDDMIGRSVKTSSLLGLRSPRDYLEVAQLGTLISMQFKNADGEMVVCNGSDKKGGPPILSTPDRKGLLILKKQGPIIVRGGRMKVTERGIVK